MCMVGGGFIFRHNNKSNVIYFEKMLFSFWYKLENVGVFQAMLHDGMEAPSCCLVRFSLVWGEERKWTSLVVTKGHCKM